MNATQRSLSLVTELKTQPKTAEPAIMIGGLGTFITAIISIVLYFYPNLSDDVVQTIQGLLITVLPLLVSWVIRRKVWSPQSVQDVVHESVRQFAVKVNKREES